MALKLGKAPATHDKRDLLFESYAATALPTPPVEFGHENVIGDYGMLGNGPDPTVGDTNFQGAGDCVWAGADHETMIFTKLGSGNAAPFNGKTALADYSAVTGYRLDDESTDRGTNVRDAMKYRQKVGILDANGNRHKIGAYLALEPGNYDHVIAAMYLFGAVGIGIEFPESAMSQFNAGKRWSVVAGAQIDGGHYIPLVARRHHYLDCVTWGRVQPMTRTFYAKYCDEAWAILSPELLKGGRSPEGFNLGHLQADLAALGH